MHPTNSLNAFNPMPQPAHIAGRPLCGRRILVVEDEPVIAMLLEAMLADLGCEVVGPVGHVAEALDMISATAGIDAAVLDVNLHGKRSDAIADALARQSIPFVFSTGYGKNGLCEAHSNWGRFPGNQAATTS